MYVRKSVIMLCKVRGRDGIREKKNLIIRKSCLSTNLKQNNDPEVTDRSCIK